MQQLHNLKKEKNSHKFTILKKKIGKKERRKQSLIGTSVSSFSNIEFADAQPWYRK